MKAFRAMARQSGLLVRPRSVAFLVAVWLGGCALATDDFAPVFTDPSKFDFLPCPELAKREGALAKREQELRALMDKAAQSTGGAVVGALAYQTDYLNARGELKLVQEVAQRKDCAREVKRGP
jgi:hypothetical protein